MPRREDTIRTCCLSRQARPVAELVRFVVSPGGELVPDVDAKAPGRGVWVTLSAEAVAEAQRRGAFAASLREKVRTPGDLALATRSRLEQRLTGALGLARKAGQLVTGAAKVEAAIASGKAVALFTASDAAPDGRAKMLAALRRRGLGVPHHEMLASAQLGLALGLENVIHAALVAGAAAQSALEKADRLARYLANPAPHARRRGKGAAADDDSDRRAPDEAAATERDEIT